MKYFNFHHEKPDKDKLIVWINSTLKEDVGYYKGNLFFQCLTNKSGYLPKWWRYANDLEINSYSPPVITKKRNVK